MLSSLTLTGLWFSITVQDYLSFLSNFGQAACQPKTNVFFGFPTWYKYLPGQPVEGGCIPRLTQLNDLWLILLAVVEMLLRLAAIAAVVYVLYGGVKFVTSRGNPEKTASARTAVQDALIGLIIAVAAIAVVSFVGSRF